MVDHWWDAQDIIAWIRWKIANRVKDQNHKPSRKITDSVEVLFVEDLKGKNLTASARGTIENPSKNAKRKAGLNAQILLVAWCQILMVLTYKCKTVAPADIFSFCDGVVAFSENNSLFLTLQTGGRELFGFGDVEASIHPYTIKSQNNDEQNKNRTGRGGAFTERPPDCRES